MQTKATVVIRDLSGGRISVKVDFEPRLEDGSAAHSAALQLLTHLAKITSPTVSPTAAPAAQP